MCKTDSTCSLGPVQNLSAVFVNSTSIRVMWDPPFDDDGLVSMYQLLFPGSIINIDPELRLYNVIVTLAGNTAYSITMMARNSMGLGEAANTSLTTPGKGILKLEECYKERWLCVNDVISSRLPSVAF